MKKTNNTTSTKSFFSIKAKVALLCSCFIIIAVTVNFIFMFQVSQNAITNSTETTMKELAASYNSNVTQIVNQYSRSANFLMSTSTISDYVSSGGKSGTASVKQLVKQYLSSNSSVADISIVDADGKVLYSSCSDLIGKDLSAKTYFKNMVSSGLSTEGGVVTSSTGDTCVTFAIPLRTDMQVFNGQGAAQATNNSSAGSSKTANASVTPAVTGTPAANSNDAAAAQNMGADDQQAVTKFTGAIITSVKVSAFSSAISDIKVESYKTGYAFLLDSEGNVIYYPGKKLIGTKLNNAQINAIIAKVKKGKSSGTGTLTYNYKNDREYAAYSINSSNNWILFVAADQAEVLASLNIVATNTLMISIFLVIILSLLSYLFTGRITKSIKRITNLIHKTSELDFSEDKSFALLSSRKDETGEMSRAIEKMRDILKDMILHISEVSGKITESSESLSNNSIQVNDHASDNSATAEELSASMQETAATTEQIYTTIEQISNNSNDIAQKVTLGAELSSNLISSASALKNTTISATTKTQKIYEEVKAKTDAAIEQSKAVEKIGILSQSIKDIANQTSLLALNASIEAARAGESGSGFAVVASEIGNLANQSTKTVSHITEVVEEVYQAVGNMSKSLEQTLNFLEANVLNDYNHFLSASEEYNTDAGTMNDTMAGIQKQIEMLNANVQGISESISEINSMVNETSKGVNDVADSNTNIVSLTSNTQEMVQKNTEYADGLREIVEKFKLE